MRLAYLVPWRGGRSTGPYKKIVAQARAWTELGVTVGLFVATSDDSVEDWRSCGYEGLVTTSDQKDVLAKVRERAQLVDAVLAWRPDGVYERHGLWTPALSRMSRSLATVIEVNGDDQREFELDSRAKGTYNRITRGANFRRAVGLVHVTSELASNPSYAGFGKPSIVVANGIDLSLVPSLAATRDPRPRLAWLGDPRSPFHSLDDVVRLAASRPDWGIDVIGPEPRRVGDRALRNVEWHRAGPPEVYLPVLARCDVGIGTLNAYRTGMQEASALKVREYLACGLATVIGYRDTDFPDPVDHVLQVPNAPGGILEALPALDAFVARWHGQRVPRTLVEHLDVRGKEKRRLGFIQEQIGRSPRPRHRSTTLGR